jgi:hypothetical protein
MRRTPCQSCAGVCAGCESSLETGPSGDVVRHAIRNRRTIKAPADVDPDGVVLNRAVTLAVFEPLDQRPLRGRGQGHDAFLVAFADHPHRHGFTVALNDAFARFDKPVPYKNAISAQFLSFSFSRLCFKAAASIAAMPRPLDGFEQALRQL